MLSASSRLLAQRKIASFARHVVRSDKIEFDYRLRQAWFHLRICEALDDLVRFHEFKGQRGGLSRLSISMPPQHGKSLHGAELLPAFVFGRMPDARVMLATYSSEFAKRAIDNTQRIMKSREYADVFDTRIGSVKQVERGGTKTTTVAVQDTATFMETLRLRDPENPRAGYEPARGSYIAQGMNGQISGRGADVGIIDDLIKNAAEARSPAHYAAMWKFYTSCFQTRGSPHAVQLYIATRWTSPDFAEELADFWRMGDHAVSVLKFAAICEQIDIDEAEAEVLARWIAEGLNPAELTEEQRLAARLKLEPRVVGETLDNPKWRPSSWYYSTRTALLSQEPWVWEGMYQQRPSKQGGATFPHDAWRFYDETYAMESMGRQFGCIDFSVDAAMTETGASFSVIQVTAVVTLADCENWFLLEESRGHWDDTTLITEFQRLYAKWHAVFPEQVGHGRAWVENKALGPVLVSRLAHCEENYNFRLVPKATGKIACHRLAATEIRELRYWLPRGRWGVDPTDSSLPLFGCVEVGSIKEKGSFIYEMASFTKPDDRRDALSQQVICTSRYLGIDLLNVR